MLFQTSVYLTLFSGAVTDLHVSDTWALTLTHTYMQLNNQKTDNHYWNNFGIFTVVKMQNMDKKIHVNSYFIIFVDG